MHGKPRDRMSRLKETVVRGSTTALVSAGLDWTASDKLALLPTALQHQHTDYLYVQSYNRETGVVTFTDKAKFYHWGQSMSTADNYNGVDMRGEVVLLTRNVKVIGDDTDSWGGQIVVSDNIEDSGVKRSGQLTMDHVEVYNCSQMNTFRSAIRFEGVNNLTQVVRNVAVHGSLSWSISSQFSSNVLIEDSAFIGARQIGLHVLTS